MIKLLFIAAVVAFVIVGAPVATISAEAPAPKNVADYFLLMPEKYMPYYDLRFRQELLRGERRGAIIDIRNGFISWDASDSTEYFEFAIFRRSSGDHVVAYSVPYDDQFPDASTFLLLSYENGSWRNDTNKLLPVKYDNTRSYKLPRHGSAIDVFAADGTKLYTLVWSKDRFVKQRISRSGRANASCTSVKTCHRTGRRLTLV